MLQGIDYFTDHDLSVFAIVADKGGCVGDSCNALYGSFFGIALLSMYFQWRFTSKMAGERRKRKQIERGIQAEKDELVNKKNGGRNGSQVNEGALLMQNGRANSSSQPSSGSLADSRTRSDSRNELLSDTKGNRQPATVNVVTQPAQPQQPITIILQNPSQPQQDSKREEGAGSGGVEIRRSKKQRADDYRQVHDSSDEDTGGDIELSEARKLL